MGGSRGATVLLVAHGSLGPVDVVALGTGPRTFRVRARKGSWLSGHHGHTIVRSLHVSLHAHSVRIEGSKVVHAWHLTHGGLGHLLLIRFQKSLLLVGIHTIRHAIGTGDLCGFGGAAVFPVAYGTCRPIDVGAGGAHPGSWLVVLSTGGCSCSSSYTLRGKGSGKAAFVTVSALGPVNVLAAAACP